MRGQLLFEDVGGKKTSSSILGLDTAIPLTNMQAFAVSLQAYTNAAIGEYSITHEEIQDVTGDNPAIGPYRESQYKALINMNFVENGETKTMLHYLPSPDLGAFTHLDEVGYIMNQVEGEAYRDAVRTLTGIAALQFVSGVIEFRDGKSARPSSGAFIEFEDDAGRRQYMSLPRAANIAAVSAFASALFVGSSAYTNCAVRRVGVLTPERGVRADTPTTDAGFDSVNTRAKLNFSFVDGNDKKYMKLSLPAPKSSIFLGASSRRKRFIDSAVGQGIALALTALHNSARTVVFENGYADVQNLVG